MQKPQCTQARRILSASAMSGSASCASENSVFMSQLARVHPAAVENAVGSKLARTRSLERREHRRPADRTHRRRRRTFGARTKVAWPPAASTRRRTTRPARPAAAPPPRSGRRPNRRSRRRRFARQRLTERPAGGRRTDDPPDRPRAQRPAAANGATSRTDSRRRRRLVSRIAAVRRSPAPARASRRGASPRRQFPRAGQCQPAPALPAPPALRPRPLRLMRYMRGPRHVEGRAERRRHGPAAAMSSSPRSTSVARFPASAAP